nr:D-alanyl-D-alanine carboxypeptidase [Streptomyces albus]
MAALLLLPLSAGPALAADGDEGKTKEPKPPARMSEIGGERLGRPGTQAHTGPGVPALPEKLTARSWIVADAESGDVLAAHNAHWKLPPASTLKMLFADTLLPKFDKKQEHKVLRAELEGMGAGSSAVGVKENLTYTVRDLWLGVFLRSGNDAVRVLAHKNGGIEKTVQEMQARAEELGALDTTVVSPDGYDAPHQVSSAYDLTLIARSGLQNADFREYCSTVSADFPGKWVKDKKTKKKKRETFAIQNTDRLLTGDYDLSPYKGVAGVKNGYTSKAGWTFTGVAQRGERVLLVTVMNPSSKEHNAVYKETAKLFDWGFEAAGKAEPVGTLVPPRGAEPTAPAGTGEAGGAEGTRAEDPAQAGAAAGQGPGGSGGLGTVLGLMGALLVVLAGAGLLVHRRWPLPEQARSGPERTPGAPGAARRTRTPWKPGTLWRPGNPGQPGKSRSPEPSPEPGKPEEPQG